MGLRRRFGGLDRESQLRVGRGIPVQVCWANPVHPNGGVDLRTAVTDRTPDFTLHYISL